MPTECCALGCKYTLYERKKNELIRAEERRSMFRIPRDEEKRRLWLAAINRDKINPKTSRICSKHFVSGNSQFSSHEKKMRNF